MLKKISTLYLPLHINLHLSSPHPPSPISTLTLHLSNLKPSPSICHSQALTLHLRSQALTLHLSDLKPSPSISQISSPHTQQVNLNPISDHFLTSSNFSFLAGFLFFNASLHAQLRRTDFEVVCELSQTFCSRISIGDSSCSSSLIKIRYGSVVQLILTHRHCLVVLKLLRV